MEEDLNGKAKTIIFLDESIGVSFHDLWWGNDFLDMTSKTQVRKK